MAQNMKDIKRRIKSVESTMKITNAMKLVSASKLRKAKLRFNQVAPFFAEIRKNMLDIAKDTDVHTLKYVQKNASEKELFIVIGGDRGLAGGYNINIFKKVLEGTKGKNVVVLPIGKVAVDYFKKNKFELLGSYENIGENITIEKAYHMATKILYHYNKSEIGKIKLAYTAFISTLSQEPEIKKVLPLKFDEVNELKTKKAAVNYDPSPAVVFESIVPQYFAGMLFGAIVESFAAEQSARSNAMDSATNNAKDIIADLSLVYNRIRQAAITNEIIEIVSGNVVKG